MSTPEPEPRVLDREERENLERIKCEAFGNFGKNSDRRSEKFEKFAKKGKGEREGERERERERTKRKVNIVRVSRDL